MGEKPISPQRQRTIEDMTARDFIEKTSNVYTRQVRTLTAIRRQELRRLQLAAACSDLCRLQARL